MRLLRRNLVPIWYSKNIGAGEVYDDDGNPTGEPYSVFSTPEMVMANVTTPTGFANVEKFGSIVSYDVQIVVEDADTPIDETTVLWVGIDPEIVNGQFTVPYNYLVRRVARSLNWATLECAEVEIKLS